MKNYIKILIILLSVGIFKNSSSQELKSYEFIRSDYRFMFYNVENLFDIYDDTLKNDDEFLPEGAKHWTPDKYQKKLANISKVITAIGQWEAPEIIGLCEIENHFVLEELTKKTFLKKQNYSIIHVESKDQRGIDVALLYRKDRFKPINFSAVNVDLKDGRPTRDILYVKGVTKSKDTLHIFINHWPSRYGGQAQSEPKRIIAAKTLKLKTDSIFSADKNPAIIIMGDLNDYPDNISVTENLYAQTKFDTIQSNKLYNLSYYLQFTKGQGTQKHRGNWGILDQIIVSGTLLNNSLKISTSKEDAHVFNADFLLENDERNTGQQPFRTYGGMKFLDGYSDHLPVYLDLKIKK